MENPSVTKEQFEAFVQVRDSGLTNMWAVDYVIQLASDMADVTLSSNDCLYIIKHFGELADHYKVVA